MNMVDDSAQIRKEKREESGGGSLALLAVSVLPRFHPAEDGHGETVHAGITADWATQDHQPQQTLTKTPGLRLMNITFVTAGTPGHTWASQIGYSGP
jgi:hypothetical protein